MYQIVDNIKVPSSVLAMVEYSDEMYILGLKHIKDGLIPVGKKYIFTEGPQDMIYSKEACYLQTVGTAGDQETPVTFGDGYGEGVFSSVYRKTDDTTYRYETYGKSKSVMNGIAVRDITTGYTPIRTIWKSTAYDIVAVRGLAQHYIHLYTISNIDGTAAAVSTTAVTYTNYSYLDEDTSYVYIMAYGANGSMSVIKFDKVAKTSTVITTISSLSLATGPKASFYTKNMVYKYFVNETKTYIPMLYVNASNAICLRMVVYDKSVAGTDIATKMSYSDYTLTGSITMPTTAVSSFEYFFRPDGVLVIGHTIFGIATAMGAASLNTFGLYTLTLDHDLKTAEVKGFVQGANVVPVHFMYDGDVIYGITVSSYSKLEYDGVNKKYIKTAETPTAHKSIGRDSRGYIYFVDNNNALQCATPSMVRVVEAYCEDTEIESNTYPIQTTVKVFARNSTGEKMAKPVTLVISNGPGVWSNGLKTIEVTTSATEDIAVPLTLTGQGEVIFFGKVSGAIS